MLDEIEAISAKIKGMREKERVDTSQPDSMIEAMKTGEAGLDL